MQTAPPPPAQSKAGQGVHPSMVSPHHRKGDAAVPRGAQAGAAATLLAATGPVAVTKRGHRKARHRMPDPQQPHRVLKLRVTLG